MQPDKVKHFVGCYCIAAATAMTFAPAAGLIAGIAVGVTKEIYDKLDYGGFSRKDLIADVFGALAGAGTIHLLNLFVW